MAKALYVATVVKTHIMEFHIPYLKMLKEMGWETAVAARNDYENPNECEIPFCDSYFDVPFERNPFKLGNVKAYKQLKTIINDGEYDVIHCHTPMGGCLTRLAANKARKNGSKVFYTAHGFHFYKGAPLINWLIYYPVERFLAHKTDVLLTINTEDYHRARRFKAGKKVYIPGVGIDIERYSKHNIERNRMRKENGIPVDAKVLLSVGEVNSNKNHRIVIEALPDLEDYWYVICGKGPLEHNHRKLAESLGVSERVIILGYRTNVEDYYKMSDIFVFPSKREGLGLALMEAMASEMICVASINRGTNDLLGESNLRFHSNNKEELIEILQNIDKYDTETEIKKNKEHLRKFDIKNTLTLLKQLYENCNQKTDKKEA